MESMRDIRGRMVSVQKTRKITNAMYLMASSKLKRARNNLDKTAPYFDKLQYVMIDMFNHTAAGRDQYLDKFKEDTQDIPCGYVIVTSDNGLAGAYNQNVCRLAEQELKKDTCGAELFFVGQTGRHWFEKKPALGHIRPENCHPDTEPNMWQARQLAEDLVAEYLDGKLSCIKVVYTKMLNALAAEAEIVQLLPLTSQSFPVTPAEDIRSYSTEYEPGPKEVLDHVVPNYIKGILYGCLVESFAAEQNARMQAMKNATDNADEIVRGLQLQYNRVRQAAITTELNEVVAGANAQGNY